MEGISPSSSGLSGHRHANRDLSSLSLDARDVDRTSDQVDPFSHTQESQR